MSLTYGNKNVDSKFSPILEPNLFDKNPFQPGLTYTAKYNVNEAGEVFFRLLGKGASVVGTPGTKFTHTDNADQVFTIQRDKSVSRSEEIMDAVAADVSYAAGAENLALAIKLNQEAWNAEIYATLSSGTPKTGTVTARSGAALDGTTIYDEVVDSVAVLWGNKAKPDTLLVSPATMAKLLKSDEFLRAGDLGDSVVQTGMIGQIAGLNVFMYENVTEDFIIYDHDALCVNSRVDVLRLKDAIDFGGVYAQNKIDFGSAISNGDRVLRRTTA